ncbi:hypothetical protein [Burkholderia sp. Ac-20365]|uniref:hypothetical protein n=1 Tax=Burkholderia sp. Ac-20365 TaxID=2703897 RepID=UPI00197B5CCE|nr:hypothetical protein [Burkholderia sp. Ac-20365]MBN3761259.1 hypothetical protein [Burkholderia sp. Ac-20365]
MKQEDLDHLSGLLAAEPNSHWEARSTPADLDFASHQPEDRPSATIFESTEPVATFWSYMHNGPSNAAFIAWMSRHVRALIAGELADDVATEGLKLLSDVTYRDWLPGPTPFYLRGQNVGTVTLRSAQHTEEIATVWAPRAEERAGLMCWFAAGGADLLARAWGTEGCIRVISAMLGALDVSRVKLDAGVIGAAVEIVEEQRDHRIPIAYALDVVKDACWEARSQRDNDTAVATADFIHAFHSRRRAHQQSQSPT